MKKVIYASLFLSFIAVMTYSQENDQAITDSVKTGNSIGNSNLIQSQDFNQVGIHSPLQLIQGKVPGFTINNITGNDPNPIIETQTRGLSTFILSTQPLYIIDGIPMETCDFVAPENIESIEVVKNLSDVSIYGTRAANGVVVINTKNNHTKPLTVSYCTFAYAEAYAGAYKYMSAPEWRQLMKKWAGSPYTIAQYVSGTTDYNSNTNWRDEISQSKISQSHNFMFSGKLKNTDYTALMNYHNYNGIIQKTRNQLISGRLSLKQHIMNDKLVVGLNVQKSYNVANSINQDPNLISYNTDGIETTNLLKTAYHYNPTAPVADDSYTYYNYVRNPVYLKDNNDDESKLKNSLIHIYADYNINNDLTLSVNYSKHKSQLDDWSISDYDFDTVRIYEKDDFSNDMEEEIKGAKIQYKRQFEKNFIHFFFSYQNQMNEINISGRDSSNYRNKGSESYSSIYYYSNPSYQYENYAASFKFNYLRKYFFNLNLNRETNPGDLSEEKRTEFHTSCSAAWTIINEGLLSGSEWINYLNIHAGYGTLTRQMVLSNVNSGLFMSTNYFGFYNPDLKNEKIKEFNAGMNLSFVYNRISFTAQYYNRKTENGIIVVPVPPESNGTSYFIANLAELKNQGIEISLDVIPVTGLVYWNLTSNISYNKYQVDFTGNYYKYLSPGTFFGYQFAGYNENDELLLVDNDGNPTNQIYNIDRKNIGNSIPTTFLGVTNNLKYKNFDLTVSIRGAFGFKIKNTEKLPGTIGSNYLKTAINEDPRNLDYYNTLQNSDLTLEKGDYLKIDNIALSYDLPFFKDVTQKAKIYIACNNVATFTKFTGGDPEAAGITGLYPGNYVERYPYTRIFQLGIKVDL